MNKPRILDNTFNKKLPKTIDKKIDYLPFRSNVFNRVLLMYWKLSLRIHITYLCVTEMKDKHR